jgi:hypothetical protein
MTTTYYIAVATQFEGRDLIREHGAKYFGFRRKTLCCCPWGSAECEDHNRRNTGTRSGSFFCFRVPVDEREIANSLTDALEEC